MMSELWRCKTCMTIIATTKEDGPEDSSCCAFVLVKECTNKNANTYGMLVEGKDQCQRPIVGESGRLGCRNCRKWGEQ